MYSLQPGQTSGAQPLYSVCARSARECAFQCLQIDTCLGFEVEISSSCGQNNQLNLMTCSLLSEAESAEAPPGVESQLYMFKL